MNLSQWKGALWKYIERQYEEHRPLYLSFDSRTLAEIFSDEEDHSKELEVDNAVASLNNACHQLYSRTSLRNWGLKPYCFDFDSKGRSFSICIVAQQVLAAEMMISDESYSADNYYVRYCELLGREEVQKHSPLRYMDFARVWSVVRLELLSMSGASEKTITFEMGRGKNKFRNLPISQSLLNIQSLRTISIEVPNLQEIDDNILLLKARNLGSKLSTRARTKLSTRHLQAGICAQIRSFDPSPLSLQSDVESKETDWHQEVAPLLPTDLFIEEYQEGFDRGLRIRHGTQLSATDFKETLVDMACRAEIGFHRSSDGGWEGLPDDEPLNNPECSLFIFESGGRDFLETSAEHRVESLHCEGLPQKLALYKRDPNDSGSDDLDKKEVRNLREAKIGFEGGLCVNKITRAYLRGYPPKHLFFKGVQCDSSELVKLDQETMTWFEARRILARRDEDFIIRLDYRGEWVQLRFCCSDGRERSLVAHDLSANNFQLNPSYLSNKTPSYGYLQFFNLQEVSNPDLINDERYAMSLYVLPERFWVPVNNDTLGLITRVLSSRSGVNERLLGKISRRKAAPGLLIKQVLKN